MFAPSVTAGILKAGDLAGYRNGPVIPVAERKTYMEALEKASVGEDIRPFTDFVAGLVEKRLAGEPLPAVPKPSGL